MIEIDVTLIAGRRPDLLEFTLETFQKNLLNQMRVRRLIVNIDPIWGSADDARRTLSLCHSFGWEVVSRQPETPNFCGAVQWVWSQTETEWFFHLEDDWCLARRINVDRLGRTMQTEDIGQIAFDHVEKKARKWKRGLTLQSFTTSPSFIRGIVGRTAAEHLDTAKDPEKQLTALLRKVFAKRAPPYRPVLHGSRFTPYFLFDTGRQWRNAHGIDKTLVGGASTWTHFGEQNERRASDLSLPRRRMRRGRLLPSI